MIIRSKNTKPCFLNLAEVHPLNLQALKNFKYSIKLRSSLSPLPLHFTAFTFCTKAWLNCFVKRPMKMDFSCETMFILLKLCDYDARFASCIYVIVEWLHSMSLIGIICSQSEIKRDNWNGLDLYVRGNLWFSWLVNW